MKVLFAVNDEKISEAIIKKYQQLYKEIILSKNVYYFNAIVKELQKDKTYDRIIIKEDLEPFTNKNYETIDNFIFEKLDNISDEATTLSGEDIPIILITTDRRNKTDDILAKLFGIGVYSALIGQDRSIEEVCKLIQKPRSKKEAKAYYNLDANDVTYKPENEDNVSEAEIQNILAYYKRLGRNEERYVESFDSIATQYNDQQLRVIIKFLPLNVKAVLEANSQRYQQLMSYGMPKIKQTNNSQPSSKSKRNSNTSQAINNDGLMVESITGSGRKMTKPVIIPTANSARKVQKIEKKPVEIEKEQPQIKINKMPEIEEDITQETKASEELKKGRGRPKKVEVEVENIEEQPKKQRGRPKKVSEIEEQESILPGFEEEELGFSDFEEENDYNSMLPDNNENGFDTILPDAQDEEDIFSNFADVNKENNQNHKNIEDDEEDIYAGFNEFNNKTNMISDFDDEEEDNSINAFSNSNYKDENYETISDETEIENYEKQPSSSIQGLFTSNKKIVAFIGTSKNGTSFLINNLAMLLSNQGIKTAVLDLTENKNSYYIYTRNEEQLRKIAYESIQNLSQGVAQGIKVNNNLDIYTSLPGERQNDEQYQEILGTLLQNYSLVLLDCDFKTNINYINEVQEIYLVQSMDILTIQPLTAYLRELKDKGVLRQEKLRVIINKYAKVKFLGEKEILGGMSLYNDPSMSYMAELFNRKTIPYCTIPFDELVYTKYLGELVSCNISLDGYDRKRNKDFLNSIKKLAYMVYPLVSGGANTKYNPPNYNKYGK